MSIWGKILGGVAGFALGFGPLGALAGVLAGHAVDRMSESEPETDIQRTEVKQVAFTIAVVALGAKMAKADGVVTREEIDAFKEVFQVAPEERKSVARVFDQAKKDTLGFQSYARQVARMFRDNPAVLEELLDCLFHIARADGVYHPREKAFLHEVARIFGFDDAEFRRIEARNIEPDEADPYELLGIASDASDDEVKASYRKLIKEHHPDRLVAQGMPQDVVDVANETLAAINTAYEKIRKERGLGR